MYTTLAYSADQLCSRRNYSVRICLCPVMFQMCVQHLPSVAKFAFSHMAAVNICYWLRMAILDTVTAMDEDGILVVELPPPLEITPFTTNGTG